MDKDKKSILIDIELHDMLKNASAKSGIKIKVLTETAIKYYIKKLKLEGENV